MSEGTREPPVPFSPSAVTLANIVSYEAENGALALAVSGEEQELKELLTSPHISALITTHDKVANKEYPLQSVDATDTEQVEMNGPIRIVYVEKKKDPLVRPTIPRSFFYLYFFTYFFRVLPSDAMRINRLSSLGFFLGVWLQGVVCFTLEISYMRSTTNLLQDGPLMK